MSALHSIPRSPFETSEFMQILVEKDNECATEAIRKIADIQYDNLDENFKLWLKHPDLSAPKQQKELMDHFYRAHRKNVLERAREAFGKKRLDVLAVTANEDAAAVITAHAGDLCGMLPMEALQVVQSTGRDIKSMVEQRCKMIISHKRYALQSEHEEAQQEWLERAVNGVSELITNAIAFGKGSADIILADHEWSRKLSAEREKGSLELLVNKLTDSGWQVEPMGRQEYWDHYGYGIQWGCLQTHELYGANKSPNFQALRISWDQTDKAGWHAK